MHAPSQARTSKHRQSSDPLLALACRNPKGKKPVLHRDRDRSGEVRARDDAAAVTKRAEELKAAKPSV
nr:hypothetical protein CFP56_16498 [Quercus suber]